MVANIPCLLKSQLLLINQNSQQLNGGNGWMRIIQLHFVLLRKESKSIIMPLFVSSNHVVDRCRAEEVLLLESELLSGVGRVVGVENTCDILSLLSFSNGTVVVTGVELVEIEGASWTRSPKSQVVRVVSVEAWNW